ncbi:LacI family DNA-binding transcriptional regulator [Nocardioides cavernaquae]|uniref:LacI family DNA-binding transcriptional regulator n=1 Tax=Nocardioides cavernaquae TaxID=2321396 RepID=A0A3A5HD58_9ACTN|nr:LacI family DNA-binding transcriptional regulator [Nocardioides cavernaquae]RJS45907.1 LacI family DNA-binding transcriptional regulator [Nocardioides cavernaquae]
MSPSSRPTLKDVAARAGVSITTVSVVLNKQRDGVRVPESTRDRVQKAAEELGYQPNETARGLRRRSSQAIGFLSDEVTTTPFAVAMLAAAQDEAADNGQLLFTLNIGKSPSQADLQRAVDSLVQHQVSSLVVAHMYHKEVDPIPSLPDSTVFLNCRATSGHFRSIVPDETTAAYTATRELIDNGHRRIAYLDDATGTAASKLRLAGYFQALTEAGITPDPDLHVRVTPLVAGGVRGGELLDLPEDVRPTGVFCFNDRAAMGFYRAVRQRGLSVPNDISVVGFDDQEFIASELDPPLTTMQLPHAGMGKLAIKVLLGQDTSYVAWEPNGDGKVVRMQCPIVRRESVAPPPAAG